MSASKMETHTISKNFIVEKFISLKIDDDPKNTLLDLWKDKNEVKYTLCVFTEWLLSTVDAWCTSGVAPGSHTTSFTLSLAAILCTNEERFARLNNNNFFAKLIRVTKVRESGVASVQIAYVKLLSAFLEHEAGVEWMVACNFWEDVLELCVTGSGGIVKESVSCVGKLLEKAVGHDESFCDGVVKKIMLPLGENIYRCVKASSDVNEDVATELLRTSLKVIGDVLEFLLRGVCLEGKDFEVLFLFLKNFHLEERICDFMIIAQNKRLLFDLSKIMFVMQFLELYGNVITKNITMTKIKASVDKIRNNFTMNLFKGTFSEQVEFCRFSFLFWKLMDSKLPDKYSKERTHFSNELLCMFMVPVYIFLSDKFSLKLTVFEEEITNDDFRCALEDKMWSMISFDFIRAIYFWDYRILKDPNLGAFCEQALNTSKNCIVYFSREQGIMYFQTLVYILIDFVWVTDKNSEKIAILVKDFPFCRQIFEQIGILIEKFQITLKDCIETTYVINVCFDFMALTEWNPAVIVDTIKVINIAIAHYMAPNMALLVEDAPDPTINSLGPLLYSKLLHKDPKVKNVALEVIVTTATISNKKEKLVLRVCAEWLTHAVATWSTSKLTSGPRSICFTLNLTALLCENESTFNQLNNNNFFAKLVKATKATQSKIKKVKLAYIKLLSTFLEHAAGVEWLVACCFWEDIIEWSLTGDDDVVAKSTLLLQKILDKTIDSDENFCDRVVKKIMVPLGENIYRGVKVCGDVSDVEALQPSLKLMGNILEHFLNAVYLEGYNFRVLFVFLRNFHLEERICDFMIIAQNKRLLFDLSKIMFVMQFLELYANTVTGGTTLTKVSASVVRIQSNFMANMVRGTYLEQVDFCPFSMLFWKLMESKVPTITARFSGQFMFLLSIPFGCVIMKYLIKLTEIEEAISHDQLRSAVETKVWEMVSYDYVRVMYFWTRKISDGTDTVAMCKHSFLALEKCLKYLSRDHAVTFFQCFVYFLVDLLNSAKESPEKVDVLVAKFPNIDQIFEIVGTLTQTFQIGLKDAVETTYVLPLCFDFLALASWSSQVVLSIINLINTGSAHYMAPNLALLMEDTPDSPLALLGPLLYSKLLNDHPDIQRASLDVVRTIARISSTKHKIAKLVTKWVKKAVTKWSTARVPSRDLVVFVVDLILLLVRTEEKFRDLKRSDNFFVSLFSVLRQAKPELSIRVLLALVEHQSGTDFVVELGLWKSVFGLLACGDQTQCVCFMAKLLRKSGFQSDIVKELVLPLENHTKFFSLLLERCLEEVFSGVGDFDALFAFLGYYRFDDDIGDRALSKSYVFDSSKVRLTMQFVELYAKITSKSVTRTTVDVSLKKIKSSFLTNLSKQSFDEVIEFSRFGLLYWRLIESKIPETNSFSDQIVATFLISHYGFVLRNCLTLSKIEEACLTDEVRDVFVAKVMKMLGDVTRLHFIWRDRLIESPDLVKFCENSLLRVKECRYYLSRHQAVVFFQTLIYLTKDITLGLSESSEKIQVVREDADYICKIFDLLGIFIQEIRITWKDTVEALEVVNVCFEFLELCEWSEDVVVQVLTVVNVAVKKYMLPSLVLLVDITQDSTVALLGTFMKLKLEESGAKVKTAALKVVCTVAYLSNERIESALVLVPLFTEWIKKAVTLWSVTGAKPRAPIVCFTVRIATMLSKNEEVFCELNKDSLFLKLIAVLDLREDDRSYLELLEGFLEHESGVEWIVAYDFWEDVFKSHCDESAHFIAKLLEKTIDREEFCVRVIKRLIGPVFSDCGSSSVALSAGVLENFLRRLDLRIPLLFYENCQSIPELSCDFEKNKVVYTLQMLELYKANDKSASANIDSALDKIRATFISSICSRNFEHVIELCDFGQIYWTFVDAKISKLPHHTVFLIIPLLSPHFTLSMKYFPKADEDIDDLFDEYRKGYVDSMLSRMSHDSIRSCYKCRDGLLERAELFELAVASTGCLKRTRHLFCKDAAVMVFQTIVYILRDFVRTMKKFPETLANFGDQFDYFLGNFELLCLLVDDFGITWCDIYEIIYVLPASFDFLTMLRCPVDVTVQVLRLIDVTIAKSVAPNLTLLIDSTHNLFGPLLYVKLRDDVAEVRNVALAVIRTVARMAYIKFPSLQKVLMDSELPTLVVKMSTCDGESFVRATAIKCLQEMIQVEEIWNNALKTEDLSQKMRDILLNETEGIVRVEAATFMCVAYEHQQFPKDSLDAIYETMIYSSTTDLHWEVKVRALNFWDKVIKNHLQNQGMIDGSFPNVTFSKEHRKIVTLTDSEIRKRLLKVLGQLSAIGCLGVLTAAIKDDCDMEVSKTAVKITQKLVDLLKKYAVGGECSGPTSPIPTESGMSMSSGISVDESMDSPRSSQPDLNEEIIEQIVNAKDASLLKGVYAPSDYGSVSNYDFQVRKIVTPTEFLQFTHQDLNNIIAEKKKWLNGIEDLGSLLDDMLKTYDEDVNSMDCY